MRWRECWVGTCHVLAAFQVRQPGEGSRPITKNIERLEGHQEFSTKLCARVDARSSLVRFFFFYCTIAGRRRMMHTTLLWYVVGCNIHTTKEKDTENVTRYETGALTNLLSRLYPCILSCK